MKASALGASALGVSALRSSVLEASALGAFALRTSALRLFVWSVCLVCLVWSGEAWSVCPVGLSGLSVGSV